MGSKRKKKSGRYSFGCRITTSFSLKSSHLAAPIERVPPSQDCHVRTSACTSDAAAVCVSPAALRAATISAGSGLRLMAEGLGNDFACLFDTLHRVAVRFTLDFDAMRMVGNRLIY